MIVKFFRSLYTINAVWKVVTFGFRYRTINIFSCKKQELQGHLPSCPTKPESFDNCWRVTFNLQDVEVHFSDASVVETESHSTIFVTRTHFHYGFHKERFQVIGKRSTSSVKEWENLRKIIAHAYMEFQTCGNTFPYFIVIVFVLTKNICLKRKKDIIMNVSGSVLCEKLFILGTICNVLDERTLCVIMS